MGKGNRFFACICAVLLWGLAGCAASSPKAPFRTLYDNDVTYLLSIRNPHRAAGAPFDEAMLRAAVAEAADAGADAQIMSAGSWVPWWRSEKFPIRRQLEWFAAHYGKTPAGAFTDYLKNGGDMMAVFVEECRRRGQAAIGAIRLNDLHHLYDAFNPDINPLRGIYISEFYATHPQYRLGTGKGVVYQGHNWLIPEARAHKFEQAQELVRLYDLDGLELDFLRAPFFFPCDRAGRFSVSEAVRVGIMTDFIRRVRDALDRTSRDGRKRWLVVRIPAEECQWGAVGFDPAKWREAGVDIFNVSNSYNLTQQTDIAKIRRAAPDAAIYSEMTYCAHRWYVDVPDVRRRQANNLRRADRTILENAMRVAYARGADGASFFNFVYYCISNEPDIAGPYAEPPWDYVRLLGEPQRFRTPPYYFYAPDERFPAWEKRIDIGEHFSFSMDTARPPDAEGILRLQLVSDEEQRYRELDEGDPFDRGRWRVYVNGVPLEPTANRWGVSALPVEFEGGMGSPCQYLAWRVPRGALRDAKNEISLTYECGERALWLRWAEIFFPETLQGGR